MSEFLASTHFKTIYSNFNILVPAGDHEWSFVVNFETVAIRFSCNSRATMEEWVDCIRNKLGEMGILNPKGNLYSKVPTNLSPTKTRNPMSPLPQPPPVPGMYLINYIVVESTGFSTQILIGIPSNMF